MKTWIKAILCIALSLMCVFTGLGYAAISDQLIIEGDLRMTPPNALFIASISVVEPVSATIVSDPVNIGFPSTKMMTEILFESQNDSVTLEVLIVNGTPVAQYFDQLKQYPSMEGIEGSFSYERVKATVDPGQGTAIGAGERKTFTVTLKYTGTSTNQTRKMLYEFEFVLRSDDLTEAVSKGVTDKFADILNNRLEEEIKYVVDGSEKKVAPEKTYDAVINNMEDDTSGNYIGNLMGATAEDKALLTALFEGELTFPVGDQEVPVTVMIKQKDVYGSDNKDDLVLYITADDLGTRFSDVPVYAVVFSQDASGEWKQIGQIFAGEARVNGYNGSFLGTGSFNTESWKSINVYYGVSNGSDIKKIMTAYKAQNS